MLVIIKVISSLPFSESELFYRITTMPHVCVIGAGIIGLSTALNVQEMLEGVTVTIVAEDVTPNTTSDIAGGIWEPYLMGDTPEETVR